MMEAISTLYKQGEFNMINIWVSGIVAICLVVTLFMPKSVLSLYPSVTMQRPAGGLPRGSGGVGRLYQGLWAALLQAPLARFGDTAANAGALALLETTALPVALKTFLASCSAALFRIAITPIDTLKTMLQVAPSPRRRGIPTPTPPRLSDSTRGGATTTLHHRWKEFGAGRGARREATWRGQGAS